MSNAPRGYQGTKRPPRRSVKETQVDPFTLRIIVRALYLTLLENISYGSKQGELSMHTNRDSTEGLLYSDTPRSLSFKDYNGPAAVLGQH